MDNNTKFNPVMKITLFYFVFFLAAVYPILAYTPIDFTLKINRLHSPMLDIFAIIFTYLGNLWGYIVFLLALIVLQKNIQEIVFAAASFFFSCIIVQVLKHLIFSTSTRPIGIIELKKLHLPISATIESTSNSFPSGHSSTAFVIAVVVCMLFFKDDILLAIIPTTIASSIAISRVYACMHFYHDVYVGAFIGTFVTIVNYFVINNAKLTKYCCAKLSDFMCKIT